MANKYANTDKDIHTRIFKYVVRGIKIIRLIPKTSENIPIIEQVSRSLTSMGANDQEADAAITRKDFIAKYAIVLKETKETIYWWKVLEETGFKNDDTGSLISEGKEIFMIVSAITKNTKNIEH